MINSPRANIEAAALQLRGSAEFVTIHAVAHQRRRPGHWGGRR